MNAPKRFLYLLPLLVAPLAANAQNAPFAVQFSVNTSLDTHRISPYVYGSNGHSDDWDENMAARRLGGNRLTGYNWENNASNAGSDYVHHSDNYLSRDMPAAVQDVPGYVITDFHDTSLSMGAYSLITLPAAGYVARDKNGTVQQSETAPSARWNRVEFLKEGPLSLVPDLNDNVVYVDEEVNFLVNKYGSASTARGIKGYAVDNEPALWVSTHPRIHPTKPTVAEVIERGLGAARAVKRVDPAAEVFGPVAYGFSEYFNFQEATDWNSYQSYGTFLGAYLAKMKEAGDQAGVRLLDVLDLHWYPEAQGKTNQGNWMRITFGDPAHENDDSVAYARMQAPRSLWDSSYTEHSWIGQWFSPIALVPNVKSTIARHYPGTKLAFTEINYGGDHHISGGIAMADVLGIFGRHGVYMSNYWGAVEGYVSAAYRIYRNYDGQRSTFGDVSVRSATSDLERSSLHAALKSGSGRTLHLVAINKSMTDQMNAEFTIEGAKRYGSAAVYAFDKNSASITRVGTIPAITDNRFSYAIPALTVAHIVLEEEGGASGVTGHAAGAGVTLDGNYPNPFAAGTEIRYTLPSAGEITLRVLDMMGRPVATLFEGTREAGSYAERFDGAGLAAGRYYYELRTGANVLVRGMDIVR